MNYNDDLEFATVSMGIYILDPIERRPKVSYPVWAANSAGEKSIIHFVLRRPGQMRPIVRCHTRPCSENPFARNSLQLERMKFRRGPSRNGWWLFRLVPGVVCANHLSMCRRTATWWSAEI